ncbi:hypothetical protein EMPS_11056 [Entomortierella parvispora]|uniref:F-box domain-containing protein n=1 Tax=Entomortierella parvispora TaxID=205924 RepID=A0A9P3M1Y6_9FUNG|nr:hypothetical protein EMPS_11056 [Entomortierella parvispora]
MPAQHPLDLPEIRDSLARFLTRRELALCCRVSHEWRQSFEPFVWKELMINNKGPREALYAVSVDALQLHSAYVQSLIFSGVEKKPYLKSLTLPNLRKLKFFSAASQEDHRGDDQLEFVLQCRKSLRSLTVIHGWNDSTPVLEAAHACPSLMSLTLVGTGFARPRHFQRYWVGLWSRLTRLSLRAFDFCPFSNPAGNGLAGLVGHVNSGNGEESDSDEDPREPIGASFFEGLKGTLGHIKVLELIQLHGLEDDLLFLKLCPNLETLVWKPLLLHRGLEHLTNQAKCCPKLARFHSTITLGDDDHTVARFIESRSCASTVPFWTIDLQVNWLSEAAWELLKQPSNRHHLLTLRALDLKHLLLSTPDNVIQEVLCSLPNLEDFKAVRLREEYIVWDPRPWICTRLYRLVLEIVPSLGSSAQTMLLERISGLRSLQTLDLSGPYWASNERSIQALIFRLDCGLDLLRSLHNLVQLELGCKIQDWREKDVEWMLEHWPRLRKLKAVCHRNSQKNKALQQMLVDGGVNLPGDTSVRIIGFDQEV